MNLKQSRKRTQRIAALTVLAVLIAAVGFYLGDFYHADTEAIEAFCEGFSGEISVDSGDNIVVIPDQATAGMIFYPGGKVEYTAYMPLMKALAEKGVLCILVKMPFHLAVLDSNAADGIPEQYPEIESWYIGGHSLGGAMGASYVSKHPDAFEGLVLLGAYSTADLSHTELQILSVYGSEDGVMNREKYRSCLVNLPADYREVVLEGGCHAYFGMYGHQNGDGTASLSPEEQILLTSDLIAEWIYAK